MPLPRPTSCKNLALAVAIVCAVAGCAREPDSTVPDSTVPDSTVPDSIAPDTTAADSAGIVATYSGGTIHIDQLVATARQSEDPDTDWRIEAIRDLAIRQTLLARDPTPLASAAAAAATEPARRAAILQALTEQLGWNAVTVSEEETRAHYEQHPDQYQDAAQLRLQHIYLRSDRDRMTPEERQAVRERAEAIQRELVAGADFTSIARRSSESETAFSGGHMALKQTDRVEAPFAEAAWRLEIGEISDVVEVSNGFHILTATQRIEERSRPFDEVYKFAESKAFKAKKRALQEDWLAEVGPRYDLEKHYELLEDPLVDFGAALISYRGGRYTVSQLAADLPRPLKEHFYQGYSPQVLVSLDDVALQQVVFFEAQTLGLQELPEVVEAADAARQQALYQATLEALLRDKARDVPDEELEEFYWQNEERYKTLRTIDVTLIHLPIQKGKSLWELLREGEDLAERIRQGESMEDLAREHSRHYSAASGGRYFGLTDMGLAERIQSAARFRRQFDALAPGEVAVIRSECFDSSRLRYLNTGVMVYRLDRLVPPSLAPFEDTRDLVRQSYLRRNYQRMLAELRAELLDEFDLEIFTERLPIG